MNGNSKVMNLIKNYDTISIIGMDKNVGKTTTLNYLIKKFRKNKTLGLSSIGRDGEKTDVVFSIPKPRIYIEKGTIIATAKNCLFNGDITKEILRSTGIHSPLGEIIIVRALSDGFVEIAGPSQTKNLKKVCDQMLKLGCDIVLIDGALSRKSFASPIISQATILATGASLSKDIKKVVELTEHTINLLSWEIETDPNILSLCKSIKKIGIIQKNNEVIKLNLKTALNSSKEILSSIDSKTDYIVIKGVFGDKFLKNIMKNSDSYQSITFLVEDGTKLFLSKEVIYKFQKTGGKLKVLNPINLIFITANPFSPLGFEFDKKKFLNMLREKIKIPVFNLLGGKSNGIF